MSGSDPAVVESEEGGGTGSSLPGRVLSFLWTWAQVGFVTGTLTLLGPVRWISDRAAAGGWSEGAEHWAVRGAIVVFVAGSAALSLVAARALGRVGTGGRATALAALAAVTLGTVWLWMTPAAMASFQASEVTATGRFTFGPYPDRARLENLRRQGYEGVISLLHPAVVPFEPKLLADEREAAAAVGIELVHAPMLPWITDNEAALATVRDVAQRGVGRYYVHCYLGKDRVEVVRRFLASMSGAPVTERVTGGRSLAKRQALERGPVVELDTDLFLIPFPTDEEMVDFFQGGNLRHVVSLLDPDRREDVPWIDKEAAALRQVGVPMTLSPVPWQPYRPAAVLEAVSHIRELPRPLAVHAFRANGIVWEALVLAWGTGLPPLPPALFVEPMAGGRPELVGINVAVGPAPAPSEFGAYLATRGIRGVVYVGDRDRPSALIAARAAAVAGLQWHTMSSDAAAVIRRVSEGGPWYVYGPGLGGIQSGLDDALNDPSELLQRIGPPPATEADAP